MPLRQPLSLRQALSCPGGVPTLQYRGIRFVLRTSIVRRHWRVAVFLDDKAPIER